MFSPERRTSWGLLGGSFDPVHLGHISLATQICFRRQLDGVALIPSWRHAFKRSLKASYDDRLEMCRLAIQDKDNLAVCDIERRESLSGYALDTVLSLKDQFPTVTFFFVAGEDILADFECWYRPNQLLDEVAFLIGFRSSPGNNLTPPRRMELISTDLIDISATDVRQMVACDPDDSRLDVMVPQPVLQYIRKQGLYNE